MEKNPQALFPACPQTPRPGARKCKGFPFLRKAKGKRQVFPEHGTTLRAGNNSSQEGFSACLQEAQAHTRQSATSRTHCWTLRPAKSCLAWEERASGSGQGFYKFVISSLQWEVWVRLFNGVQQPPTPDSQYERDVSALRVPGSCTHL